MNLTDLSMFRGDTGVFKATFNDDSDNPINDPGAMYRMTIRRAADDADPPIYATTAAQASPGLALLIIPPSATAAVVAPAVLVYDVQVTETGGRITTVAFGRFFVLDDVSKLSP